MYRNLESGGSQQVPLPIQHVGAPQPVVILQEPISNFQVKASITKVIGILQILIGILFCCFGFGFSFSAKRPFYRITVLGFGGVISGIWITVTGIIGIVSATDPRSQMKNGVNMGFSIVSCVAGGICIILYSISLSVSMSYGLWRKERSANIALSATLLLLGILEFIIGLTASILCCTYCCCRNGSQAGTIMAHPQQQYVITSSSGQHIVHSQGYPMANIPDSAVASYPNQGFTTGQGGFVSQAGATSPMTTDVTYSSQEPPPVYTEK